MSSKISKQKQRKKPRRRIAIVDAANFLYRAFFAIPGLRASDGLFLIRGTVYRAGEEVTRLESVSLTSEDGWRLETSVNVRAGQTIVLGSSPQEGSSATLFLTVRAEEDTAAAGAEAR